MSGGPWAGCRRMRALRVRVPWWPCKVKMGKGGNRATGKLFFFSGAGAGEFQRCGVKFYYAMHDPNPDQVPHRRMDRARFIQTRRSKSLEPSFSRKEHTEAWTPVKML